jgi:hypothetical protein
MMTLSSSSAEVEFKRRDRERREKLYRTSPSCFAAAEERAAAEAVLAAADDDAAMLAAKKRGNNSSNGAVVVSDDDDADAGAGVAPSTSPATTTTTTRKHHRRKSSVRFGSVEIVEFPFCIGDNPSVHGGVPLSMAMEPISRDACVSKLDDFERQRSGCRDHGASLVIGKEARERMYVVGEYTAHGA